MSDTKQATQHFSNFVITKKLWVVQTALMPGSPILETTFLSWLIFTFMTECRVHVLCVALSHERKNNQKSNMIPKISDPGINTTVCILCYTMSPVYTAGKHPEYMRVTYANGPVFKRVLSGFFLNIKLLTKKLKKEGVFNFCRERGNWETKKSKDGKG